LNRVWSSLPALSAAVILVGTANCSAVARVSGTVETMLEYAFQWLVVVQLREIAVGSGGGVASVHVDGFEQLMPIFIGVAEAAALVYATTGGGEGRRPSTLGTWKRSLEVCPIRIHLLLSSNHGSVSRAYR